MSGFELSFLWLQPSALTLTWWKIPDVVSSIFKYWGHRWIKHLVFQRSHHQRPTQMVRYSLWLSYMEYSWGTASAPRRKWSVVLGLKQQVSQGFVEKEKKAHWAGSSTLTRHRKSSEMAGERGGRSGGRRGGKRKSTQFFFETVAY